MRMTLTGYCLIPFSFMALSLSRSVAVLLLTSGWDIVQLSLPCLDCFSYPPRFSPRKHLMNR